MNDEENLCVQIYVFAAADFAPGRTAVDTCVVVRARGGSGDGCTHARMHGASFIRRTFTS